ncbi:MAG: hypothetical protein QXW58_05640 [Thermosphaera sp.]
MAERKLRRVIMLGRAAAITIPLEWIDNLRYVWIERDEKGVIKIVRAKVE